MVDVNLKNYTQIPNFYIGVIEDSKDPLMMGRYRVRILGIDSPSKELLPTEVLPWAKSVNNIGLISEIGMTRFFRQGTYVIIFLLNNDRQQPYILGSIEGHLFDKDAKEADSEVKDDFMFKDPDDIFPLRLKDDKPINDYSGGEEDYNDTSFILKNEIGKIKLAKDNIEIDFTSITEKEAEEPSPTWSHFKIDEKEILLEMIGKKDEEHTKSLKFDGEKIIMEYQGKRDEEKIKSITLNDEKIIIEHKGKKDDEKIKTITLDMDKIEIKHDEKHTITIDKDKIEMKHKGGTAIGIDKDKNALIDLGTNKIQIKGTMGELITLLSEFVDIVTQKKDIGNQGAPVVPDPASLPKLILLKQKIDSFKK